MPKSCFQCEFRTKVDPDNLMCIISQKTFEDRFYHIEHRDESCPLVPVPDHGRLIAVLKTERECVKRDCDRNCGKCDLSLKRDEILDAYNALISLFDATTIILADKEAEGSKTRRDKK